MCQCQMLLPNIALPRPKLPISCVQCCSRIEQRELLLYVLLHWLPPNARHLWRMDNRNSGDLQAATITDTERESPLLMNRCRHVLSHFPGLSFFFQFFLDATAAAAAINKDTNKLPACLSSFFLLLPLSFVLLLFSCSFCRR